PGERVRVLPHQADPGAVVAGLEPPPTYAVDPDRAARDVVEARDQVHDRRLAPTRGSDETDQLTWRHVEAHAPEHLADAVVGEGHVLELYLAPDRPEPA